MRARCSARVLHNQTVKFHFTWGLIEEVLLTISLAYTTGPNRFDMVGQNDY